MPYITTRQTPHYRQITLDDILDGPIDVSEMTIPNQTDKKTYFRKELNKKLLNTFDFGYIITALEQFNIQHENLFNINRQSLYNTFYIPKKSGGLREINAPVPELMDALRQLKTILETNMFATYHTSAFAYVKGRCTIDSIKRHQKNHSRWFVKLDFSNFFDSTTQEFVISMFSMIFPFSEIMKDPTGMEALKKALSLCFLNGGLPQGAPISPTITNIMMIPIDHQLYNELYKMDKHYIYTRYADDILISSKTDFDYNEVQNYVLDVLRKFNAPFIIKSEKTRYGSSAGRNWNLGVMLNKDNEITIGHQRKKTFKAMCCNYICDKKRGVDWTLHDVQVFAGLISYYRSIEKDYIDYVIAHNNEKFGVDIEMMIKEDLKNCCNNVS